MKYRPITDLTDDEVKQIVNEIYEPDSFIKIVRKTDYDEILVIVCDSDGWREHIHLRDPFKHGYGFQYDNCTYDYDYDEHEKMFEQFCIAKGVCHLLKNNPYLEAENEIQTNN